MNLQKKPSPLNPLAKEWKPAPKQPRFLLPHVLYPPPPTAVPPPFLPAGGWYCTASPFYAPPVFAIKNTGSPGKMKVATARRPKCPPGAFRKCRGLRYSPPRMHSTVRYVKPIWRRKASVVSQANPDVAHSFKEKKNTSVMIKNVPNNLRRGFMLRFMDGCCRNYSLEYDFFYLPMDFRTRDNLGYAFVNFTTAEAAFRFKKEMQDFPWKSVESDNQLLTSKKMCDITWARIQGKEMLVNRFQSSKFTCDRLDYLPVVLDPPRNGSDPNPPLPVIIGEVQFGPFKRTR